MSTLPAGSYQPFSYSYLDAGGERGTGSGFGKEISAANHDAQATAWAAVLSAVDALSLGARIEDRYDDQSRYFVSRPTNGAAREIKLDAIFQDQTNGERWVATIVPCLAIGLISYDPNVAARDVVDMTTTEVAALKSALEAFPVVNPLDQTHTVHIIGMSVKRGQK